MSRPRIRSLKPEALQHRKVGRLSNAAFRLWVGLITQADDEGRVIWDPAQFRLLVFGYQDITIEDVTEALDEITGFGLARLYNVNGTEYVDLPSWAEHQVINKARKSGLPSYEDGVKQEQSGSVPVVFPEQSGTSRGRSGSGSGSGSGSEEATPSPSPPARTALLEADAEAPQDPARPAGGTHVAAAALGASDPAATVAPAAAARTGHLKLLKPEPAEFAAFYEAYTKKMARAEALKAWVKLKPDQALVVKIMVAVEAQKALGNTLNPVNGKTYIPHPASWLNGKRWNDEIVPLVVPPRPAPTSGINPALTSWGDEPKRSAP